MIKYSQMWTLLCLISVLATVISLKENDICKMPKGAEGICIPFKECPSLANSDSILFDDGYKLLKMREYACDNKPLVCCDDPMNRWSEGNEPGKPPTTPPPTTPQPNHQYNRSLLPNLNECPVDTTRRIVGGKAAGEDEFPWSALLSHDEFNSKTSFHCGGVLINKRYVLTAAHCIVDAKNREKWDVLSVRMGEYDLNTDPDCFFERCIDKPVDIKVEKVTVHENYNIKTKQNDIALIRLSQPVNYTNYIAPLCLPFDDRLKSSDIHDSDMLEVAGWGRTETGRSSNVKLKVTLPGVSNAQCNSVFQNKPNPITIYNEQLCAGGATGMDSCNGDSGGALMAIDIDKTDKSNQYWYCAGIVSFGLENCGTTGYPGVYTRISSYTDWILRNIRP